jgi:hypothetical protein
MNTPTTFLRLLKATQAERHAAPCVVPVEGRLALLRDGRVVPILCMELGENKMMFAHGVNGWTQDGRMSPLTCGPMPHDIIATLDLDATLERLVELERGG